MDSLDSQQKTDTASAGLSGRQTHFGYLFVLGVLTLHPNRVSAESRWSWQNPVPRGNTLHGVAVLDPKTAIAVGYAETVLRTDDGGEVWSVSRQESRPRIRLDAVSFVDATVVFGAYNSWMRRLAPPLALQA